MLSQDLRIGSMLQYLRNKYAIFTVHAFPKLCQFYLLTLALLEPLDFSCYTEEPIRPVCLESYTIQNGENYIPR